ncbi:MAG: ABC transporter ATP-binding protein [Firmicutes bacterium]|uniref:ABC transporter ATP-binding protein n=1 Tax=Candidatus Onthovivens merdipullorum TaxID=2840889 RepID=A0A9D9DHC9_9BACL|nr:ABC transporter ATP-binding protein [Candidatus Onthovivens merdipullorum]
MSENIIEIKNLHKSFNYVKAVNGISFKVKRGELFAFLGVNGAGKSTTINILTGILKKDSGECFIDGHNVNETMKILTNIGIVFQSSILDSKLNVYENLKYRAMLYSLSKSEFNERLNFFINRFELKDILKKPVGKLSGGQKRKIDIVRALIHHPKILILDEPTTGLDPKTRKIVWGLIEELRATNGLTVLLTTHYMEEATRANYVVIIDNGNIVTEGTPAYLKEKYANDYLKIYKYSKDLQAFLLKSDLNYKINNGIIEIKLSSTNEAKEFILNHSNDIEDLEIIKGTMDDVFLNATGKDLEKI